jgi:ectoine hydroxylase-related dioxygenase (phytanoyl-CoA dioxygenase family)
VSLAASAQSYTITDEDVRFYDENGYFILKGAFSPEDIEMLRAETVALCRGERGEVAGLPASTRAETDDAVLGKTLCIHFPHKVSQVMFDVLSHAANVATLTKFIGPNVKCMQSMLFIKSAGKPGQAWHQDEIFIPTRDRSLTGAWIALDEATVDNGCLWCLPGSHKRGVLYPQRDNADRNQFDCTAESYQFPYDDADAIPLEAETGDLVLFNGYLLHRSLKNTAPGGYRRALVNHYMSAESLLPWFAPEGEETVIPARLDNRDIVLIAGEDPYAYKGFEEMHRPHIRADGKGGCASDRNDEFRGE